MENTEQLAFIARQPILDFNHKIVSYQLLVGNLAESREAPAGLVHATLTDIASQGLLEDKSVFILADEALLASALHTVLPPATTVLQLASSVTLGQETMERCHALRQMGYKIAIRDDSDMQMDINPFTSRYVDYIKIDVRKMPLEQVAVRFKNYQFLSKMLIAENVQTLETFEACKKIGFKLMQGYYFTRPQAFAAKVINQDFTTILKLLNMLSGDEDMKSIEESFKHDPALSFKLLRYINSVGFGLSCEIQSIRHAITVIGTKQLFKWLTMLMVTAGQNSVSPALIKTAIIRGRLMELLGNSYFGKPGQDNLFVIGVFSLLDIMLRIPMQDVLSKVDLPDTICDALLHRQGVYGPFLALTEACEAADTEKLNAISTKLYVSASEVNRCHMAALSWADSMAVQT